MKRAQATAGPQPPRRTTLLELVQSLVRQGRPECEIVAAVLDLVASGRVILIGNFRGTPLRHPDEEVGSERP